MSDQENTQAENAHLSVISTWPVGKKFSIEIELVDQDAIYGLMRSLHKDEVVAGFKVHSLGFYALSQMEETARENVASILSGDLAGLILTELAKLKVETAQ